MVYVIMRQVSPLDALLPKTRQGILAALLLRPEKPWYVSELARWMHVPSSSLQRELADLTSAGILKTYRQGRMAYYQANTELPIFPELKSLLIKTAGLVNVLAEALSSLGPKIKVAFVYGSIASGREEPDSDIDLFIVGTLKSIELALPIRKASATLHREVTPMLYSPSEFVKKQMSKDHFVTRVLEKPKLIVIGSADDLAGPAS